MSSSKIAILVATLGAMTVWACAAAPNAQPAQAAQAAPAPAPAPPPAPAAVATPAPPPASRAASGQELVNTICTQCHTLDNLTRAPRKAGDWPDVIDNMVQFGLEISEADRKAVESYLAEHYSTPG